MVGDENGEYMGAGVKLTYAVGSMQGWRAEMEDTHIVDL